MTDELHVARRTTEMLACDHEEYKFPIQGPPKIASLLSPSISERVLRLYERRKKIPPG
jgi:hypothetical protein